MSYTPPSAPEIARAQNEDQALRILLAQRRLYRRAKVWSTVRGLGIGIVAIGSPIIAALYPTLAVLLASVAAGWFALNRLAFSRFERHYVERAATAQQQFDTSIFLMPSIKAGGYRLMPEEIHRLTGDEISRRRAYADEGLFNWYPIQVQLDGTKAIAIAQRANVAYSHALLNRSAALWTSLLVVWFAVAVCIALSNSFDSQTLLLAVVLPILPPLLDAIDEWHHVRAASEERRAMANQIEHTIETAQAERVRPEQLLAWQAQLFTLRLEAPLVPNWLYRLMRPRTEDEMNVGAETLAEQAESEKKQN